MVHCPGLCVFSGSSYALGPRVFSNGLMLLVFFSFLMVILLILKHDFDLRVFSYALMAFVFNHRRLDVDPSYKWLYSECSQCLCFVLDVCFAVLDHRVFCFGIHVYSCGLGLLVFGHCRGLGLDESDFF